MQEGKIVYKIISDFEIEDEARQFEAHLIRKYKQLGQAKFNKQFINT